MRFNFKRDYFLLLMLVAAVVFWMVAILGTLRFYSPVPFNDMWDGYLDFYIKANAGDGGAWWRTHNEHRIVLSRIFFWIDLSWFKGSVWFLLVVNYILVALSCFIFWVTLRERLSKNYRILGLFIVIWLISWAQHENLTWGFQSQFILAQLLPLVAFFMLHKATDKDVIFNRYFVGACFFGVLSLGSMANGMIALPLMTAYAIIARLGWKRITILASLSCIGLLAYLYDYATPSQHGSIGSSIRENPIGVILYVLTYIGGPFFHITGGRLGGIILAQVAGGILILVSACMAWMALRSAERSTLELALLFFILYIGGTALGTAGGRLIFGLDQALAPRYSTPSLMAWAALFVLLAPKLATSTDKLRWQLWVPLSALILAMFPLQLKAWNSSNQLVFETNLAGLAVALGVHDQSQISRMHPATQVVMSIGQAASDKGLSYFSRTEFKDINKHIGKRLDGFSGIFKVCQGHIESIQSIEGINNYLRVSGWMFDPSRKNSPTSIWLINQQGVVVGYGLVGQPRPDAAEVIDKQAAKSGFTGYLLSDAQGAAVTAFDPIHKCGFSSKIPITYITMPADRNMESVTVDANQVMPSNQWIGADYHLSRPQGLMVFGSFIQSDSDKGAISLQLKRGDRILYRSGPISGKQYLNLNFSDEKIPLPTSPNWAVIEFSNKALPDSFGATLRDDGDGWGEWSAIAVLPSKVKK